MRLPDAKALVKSKSNALSAGTLLKFKINSIDKSSTL